MELTQEQFQQKFSAGKIAVPILIGLSIITYMLYQNYSPSHIQTLIKASPFWLLITFLMLIARDLGYMYRIRFLTDKLLDWKQSFRVIMLWEFASCALPSVVGGSTIASYILYKEGIPLGRSIGKVMVTAFLDNLYFLVVAPIVVLLMYDQLLPNSEIISLTIQKSLWATFIISYVLIGLYVFFMAYALFVNPHAVKKLIIRIATVKYLRKWKSGLYNLSLELLETSIHLRTKPTVYWVHACFSTFLVWSARYIIIGCLIASFTDLSYQDHFLIFSRNLIYKILLFLSVTPGAAGFAELAFPLFFGMFVGSFTTIVVLVYRLVTYYLYLLIGVIIFPKWLSLVYSKPIPQPMISINKPTLLAVPLTTKQ